MNSALRCGTFGALFSTGATKAIRNSTLSGVLASPPAETWTSPSSTWIHFCADPAFHPSVDEDIDTPVAAVFPHARIPSPPSQMF